MPLYRGPVIFPLSTNKEYVTKVFISQYVVGFRPLFYDLMTRNMTVK